jgi:hypothetical protein
VRGAEVGFDLWETTFRFGAQLQAHHLLWRHRNKLATPTRPDGADIAPEHVKDEVPTTPRSAESRSPASTACNQQPRLAGLRKRRLDLRRDPLPGGIAVMACALFADLE